jgi:hypothetical protein
MRTVALLQCGPGTDPLRAVGGGDGQRAAARHGVARVQQLMQIEFRCAFASACSLPISFLAPSDTDS